MSKKKAVKAVPKYEVMVEGFVMPSILVEAEDAKTAKKVATDLILKDYPKAKIGNAVKR